MQANVPLSFKEVYRLSNLGLSAELFKFGSLTFESSKYICVRGETVSNHFLWPKIKSYVSLD